MVAIAASFVFYAYFSWQLAFLLAASMTFNYVCSRVTAKARAETTVARALLIAAIAANLMFLGMLAARR
jgi:hypothetical protein